MLEILAEPNDEHMVFKLITQGKVVGQLLCMAGLELAMLEITIESIGKHIVFCRASQRNFPPSTIHSTNVT